MKRGGFARRVYTPPPSPPLTPLVVRPNYASANDAVATPKGCFIRSEAYRKYVAAQECFLCRIVGFSQCAHENVSKGLSMKVCDSRTFPACGPHHGLVGCHAQFDLCMDGLSRDERRELGAAKVAEMQARAKADGWDMASLRRRA